MSNRIRGQEQFIRIAKDGQLLTKTWTKVKSFKATPDDEIKKEDYMGESASDLDYQFHGWNGSIDFDEMDRGIIDVVQEQTVADQNHQQGPRFTISCMTVYRETGQRPVVEVFPEAIMRNSDRGGAGRKERVSSTFEFASKSRQVINA